MSEAKGFIGQSVPRREDRRLLTGKGEFVADLKLPNMLHAAFVRSQVAHARMLKIDVSRALQRPGVVAADFPAEGKFVHLPAAMPEAIAPMIMISFKVDEKPMRYPCNNIARAEADNPEAAARTSPAASAEESDVPP